MKHLPKRLLRFLMGLLLTVILAMLAYAIYNTYNAYTKMVVEQQQEHLLITSRAVSQNLSLYISEQLRDVDILIRTPGFQNAFQRYYEDGESQSLKEYVLSYLLAQHQGVSRIYLLDLEGDVVCRYNQYPFLEEFSESLLRLQELSDRRQSGLGDVFRISPQHYGFTLVNGIMSGNDYVGTVVSVMDMETLYRRFIVPLDIHSSGNIIVKSEVGTIIMHPEPRMLGFNYFRDIRDLDAVPQYESLRRMLETQYSREEGTARCRSFSNGILPPEEEITAFSRMNIGGTAWYVSAVIPYSTVTNLVDSNIGRFVLLTAAVLAVVAVGFLSIYTLWRERQKLALEAAYLKDINRTLEELHQSREEINHYQKLQTIGALAGGIVHEFNNLLTPIMGYSEFLMERMGPDNEYYEDIDEIHKAGGRAKEIVEQILPFSRKETDSSAYGLVSLEAVLRDSVKMVCLILPATIRLETDFQGVRASVFGSATQLHQVLLNLYSNAVQAMAARGGVLTVRARRVSPTELPETFLAAAEGTYLLIQVSDTGPGIAPEHLEHIFDPFFTTKDSGEGTGLGLSVVKNILISHGGFIEVRSVPGRGSDFLIYLPVTERTTGPEPARGREPEKVRDHPAVLLVDDDARVARYLTRRLSREGYEVSKFTDPEEALSVFRAEPDAWKLVLEDNAMPKLKGTDLIRQIRQCRPTLPTILITGYADQEVLRMRREGWIDETLNKPLDFARLADAMEKLLRREEEA
ncbi:ATP-binding protein [uncultured Oscillibacter sp.]|uniref:sensor histidine kinase n=1 Tax=uncultured Oscillibacter sp. TaxID=876091 RepID=UPI002631020C|nr:ATP-binding protein [uncultured Oscillibacter sp.]